MKTDRFSVEQDYLLNHFVCTMVDGLGWNGLDKNEFLSYFPLLFKPQRDFLVFPISVTRKRHQRTNTHFPGNELKETVSFSDNCTCTIYSAIGYFNFEKQVILCWEATLEAKINNKFTVLLNYSITSLKITFTKTGGID